MLTGGVAGEDKTRVLIMEGDAEVDAEVGNICPVCAHVRVPCTIWGAMTYRTWFQWPPNLHPLNDIASTL